VVEALMRHTEAHDRAVVKAGGAWRESGCVFTTRIGTPVSPTNLRRLYVKFLAQNGIRFIRIHDMRHTAAGLSLAQGVRIESVSQALGHKDILMTKSIYAPNIQALNDEFAMGLSECLAPMKDSIDALTADEARRYRRKA
jgi:integrase